MKKNEKISDFPFDVFGLWRNVWVEVEVCVCISNINSEKQGGEKQIKTG